MCSLTSWEVGGAGNVAIVGATFLGSCSYVIVLDDPAPSALMTLAHKKGR